MNDNYFYEEYKDYNNSIILSKEYNHVAVITMLKYNS